MARKTVEELRQRIVPGEVGLLARRRRLRAVRNLAARVDGAEAARALAYALVEDIDNDVAAIAGAALGSVTAPEAVDAVCAAWASTRSPALAELVVANGWVASGPAELRVLSTLKVGRAPTVGVSDVAPLVDALTDGDPDVAMGTAQALSGIDDPAVARALATVVAEQGRGPGYDALGDLVNQPAIDVVCAVWAETRCPALAELVVAHGWVASGPAELAVLSALKAGRAAGPGPEEVVLVVVATGDPDPDIAEGARQLLGVLASPASVEALCGLVIDGGDPRAAEVVLAHGYRPADPVRRALLAFLTGQWPAYEELDFDQGLLRGAYEAAGPLLRERLASRAREAGRRDWVGVVTGGRRAVAALSEREWEAALSVLEGAGRGEDLWRLATEAPPRFGARMLRALDHIGWAPPAEADRPGFHALVALAAAGGDHPPALGGPVAPLATLEGHTDWVYCLAVTPDGSVLASGSKDSAVRLWRLPDGAPLSTLDGHTDRVWCLAVTPDGSVLASGSRDHTVRLWRLPDGAPLATLKGHTNSVSCLAVTPDGSVLASGDGNHRVRLWRLPDGAPLATLKGHSGWVRCLAVTPDGSVLASGSEYDDTVRLWRLPDGAPLATLAGHTQSVYSLAVTPDGAVLASGTAETVRLWRLPDGAPLATLKGHSGWVTCLAVTSDGSVLASGSDDGTVRLWRLPGGAPLATLDGDADWVRGLAVTPDGSVLASGGGDGTVRLWGGSLFGWASRPVATTPLEEVEAALTVARSEQERCWLELIVGLARWRRRFEVEVGDAVVHAGEFDIELGP